MNDIITVLYTFPYAQAYPNLKLSQSLAEISLSSSTTAYVSVENKGSWLIRFCWLIWTSVTWEQFTNRVSDQNLRAWESRVLPRWPWGNVTPLHAPLLESECILVFVHKNASTCICDYHQKHLIWKYALKTIQTQNSLPTLKALHMFTVHHQPCLHCVCDTCQLPKTG